MCFFNLYLKVLIVILLILGVVIIVYQIFVQGIFVIEVEIDDFWNIDVKVDFVVMLKILVKVQMFVLLLSQDYVSFNESFVFNNYGVSINCVDGNCKVIWFVCCVNGKQILYYCLVLIKCYIGEKIKEKGLIFCDSLFLEGLEKIVVEVLLVFICQYLVDVEIFVSEVIKCVNNGNDDNVKLLMVGDISLEKKVYIVEILLFIVYVLMEWVYIICLVVDL